MSQTFTELVVPKYFGSKTAASANNARTPVAFCFQIDGLTPATAYDIKFGLGLTTDLATSFGAGNIWNGTAFSGSTIISAFTTNASGSSGPVWVFFQPTGNGTRFGGGAVHNLRIGYVTTGGTIPAAPAFISTKTVTSLDIATTELTAATTDDGAFLAGTALPVSDGKYVLIYDNTAGTGDPLFAYQIRQATGTATVSQTELPSVFNDIYMQTGTSVVGSYPAVIPIGANNPNGVRRIEARNADNTVFASNTDDDGIWPGGANTTTVARRELVTITSSDAPLQPSGTDITAPTFTVNIGDGDINVAINTPIILTFDEAIRNIDDSEITNANVAALLTLKETDAAGADVPFTAAIDDAKKVITITPTADLKNSQVYYAAIVPVEDAANNATEASSMKFTTIASTTGTISNIAIVGKTPFYAGDTVAITWTSTNVANVKIEAWFGLQKIWVEVFASIPSVGMQGFIIPSFSPYAEDYKIRISDVSDATVNAESNVFTVIAVAPDLATLRAQPVNSIVKYSGIATVTYARTAFNQKYIQDATAAILIHDPTTAPGFISGTYNIGDGITNIVGKISLFNKLIELVPTQQTGEPAKGIEIVPEVRTLESLKDADQSKLVKIENFAFKTPTQYDVDGKFIASKSYDIDGFDKAVMVYRTAFAESDYIGGFVPAGPISSIVLVGQFNTLMQITARSWADMTLPVELPKLVITEIMYNSPESTDEEWFELYNNGSTTINMEGFYMVDSDTAHARNPWVFPAGSSIAPGKYFTAKLSSGGAFPFTPDAQLTIAGDPFNLGNTSDQVKIYTKDGQLIDSVQYADKAPWPTAADGNGTSLTLCDPNLDNSLASSWEASLDALAGTAIFATPGSGCVLHTAVAPKLQSGISVYPNPTSDNLYIANPANESVEITILSALGKTVKTLQSNQGVASVDLSDMPKGIYLVKVLNKTSKTTQINKVVVR
jgi:hypothetical protein